MSRRHRSLCWRRCWIPVALLAIGLASCQPPEARVVAWVESEPITVSELHYFMLLEKASVYNDFHRRHGVDFTPAFWQTELGGERPLDVLRKRALDESLTFKAQQLLAREAGIKVLTDFDALMRERLRVNARRARDAQEGRVICGPVELSARNYVGKVRDEMIIQTKERLALDRFKLPRTRLERAYAAYLGEVSSVGGFDEPVAFSSFAAVRQHEHTDAQYEALVARTKLNLSIEIDPRVLEEVTLP